jgi:hypothetical protein
MASSNYRSALGDVDDLKANDWARSQASEKSTILHRAMFLDVMRGLGSYLEYSIYLCGFYLLYPQ